MYKRTLAVICIVFSSLLFGGQVGVGAATVIATQSTNDTANPPVGSSSAVVAEPALRYITVAAGDDHSMALDEDGTVWAWGSNYAGQLGNDSKKASKAPMRIETITGVKTVAAGNEVTIALGRDGSLWSWGANDYGQLGDGTTDTRFTPVNIKGLEQVKAVALGPTHALALTNVGVVWAWGRNMYGQLGDGSESRMRATPAKVNLPLKATSIAAGGRHSLALADNGTVWSWGDNEYGQLGLGKKSYSNIPVQIAGLVNIVAIAAGAYHSIAVSDKGSVWAWGYNENGQLGTSNMVSSNVPIQLTGIDNVKAAAVGTYHTLFLRSDGTVWAVGYNNNGQLGISTRDTMTSPVQVPGLTDITSISAGKVHSMAIKADGSIWVWGNNTNYQLGTDYEDTWRPTQVLPAQAVLPVQSAPELNAGRAAEMPATNTQVGQSNQAASTPAIPLKPFTDWTTIVITPGQPTFLANGSSVDWSAGKSFVPIQDETELLVPAQPLVQALGGELSHNPESGKIIIELGKTLEMELNQTNINVAGQPTSLAVAPQNINSVLAIPLEAVVGNAGCDFSRNEASGVVTLECKRPKLVLATPDAAGEVKATQFLYKGTVLFDEKSTSLEWAAMSPDRRFVAYKAEREIRLYDVEKKKSLLVYKMSTDEYIGKWVYNYGFLPGYWYKFVGWSDDSRYFVVDKNYPGLFKGGCGYYKVNVGTFAITPVAQDDIVLPSK